MTQAEPSIQLLTVNNVVTWYQQGTAEMIVGDALDATSSAPLAIGFARYRKGASNQVSLPYDEALVITRGVFTVRRPDGVATAAAGEVIFHRAGTTVIYHADEDAELIYVCQPALRLASGGGFQPAAQALVAQLVGWRTAETPDHSRDPSEPAEGAISMDNVTLLQRIWGPLERGESHDHQPFFDALDDDVVFSTPLGELRGKQAVLRYFAHAGQFLEARPFERPLEYFGNGDRVVILGEELFTVHDSGVTARAEWAWVHDLRDGRITRITAIQDLSAVAEAVSKALASARTGQIPNPAG